MLGKSRDVLIGRLLALATWGARLVARLGASYQLGPPREIEKNITDLLATSGDTSLEAYRPLGEIPIKGIAQIDFLGDADDTAPFSLTFQPPTGTCAILKRTTYQTGMDALRRQRQNLERIHAELKNVGYSFKIPEVIAFGEQPDLVWSVESFVKGRDGRVLINDPAMRASAFVSSANAITLFKSQTLEPTAIDLAWIEEWIDRPAAMLELPIHTLMSRKARRLAVESFRQQQRRYWHGRTVPLGWYHGDFSPGNILFKEEVVESGARPMSTAAESTAVVEGIIDWDRAGSDGPVGFDICHLAIATRRALTGQQIGEIVRNLLSRDQWTPEELKWFRQCRVLDGIAGRWTEGGEAMSAMVSLVWLRLMMANMEKSKSFLSNRLWAAANIERVLQLWLPDRPSKAVMGQASTAQH